MPWSNQSGGGGGWKSGGSGGGGGGGPWGQGGGGGPWGQGGGNQPPDLEQILKRGQDKLKQFGQGGGAPSPFLWLLAAAAGLFAVVWYGFLFQVRPDELGVVMRFGQFVRQEPPGLHFRLPYPIEEVRLPKVTSTNRTEIGIRSGGDFRRGAGMQDTQNEGVMLTGDENIVDVGFVVQWDIKDAAAFLFNIQNPENTVKEVAESAMREIVGKSKVQDVLTEKRQDIERQVRELVQRVLDSYGAGIRITQLQMQRAEAPAPVVDAFRDVAAAAIDQKRIQNQAEAYANKVVPEARGEAQRILQEAQGYKEKAIAEARGEADRFLKIYDEYRKAPDVTRRRIYLETMERVLSGTDKVIIDNSKGGSGVVPFLPLDQLQQRGTTGQQRTN
jgi:membrane protease subunit HflK